MTVGTLRVLLGGVDDTCHVCFVLLGLSQFQEVQCWGTRHYPVTQDPQGSFLFDLQIVSGEFPRASTDAYALVSILPRANDVGSN